MTAIHDFSSAVCTAVAAEVLAVEHDQLKTNKQYLNVFELHK
jgi:hypothetical protein